MHLCTAWRASLHGRKVEPLVGATHAPTPRSLLRGKETTTPIRDPSGGTRTSALGQAHARAAQHAQPSTRAAQHACSTAHVRVTARAQHRCPQHSTRASQHACSTARAQHSTRAAQHTRSTAHAQHSTCAAQHTHSTAHRRLEHHAEATELSHFDRHISIVKATQPQEARGTHTSLTKSRGGARQGRGAPSHP